jgi:hypothetical protein
VYSIHTVSVGHSLIILTNQHGTVLDPRLVLHHGHDTPKGKRFVRRQLGQDFAIQVNIGIGEGWNKGRIAPVILTNARLQAHNPEFPPFPLFLTTVSVRVLPSLFDAADRNRKAVFGATAVAFGVFQERLVLLY